MGLGFIAYQQYINSSIYDRFGSLNNKKDIYKLSKLLNGKRTEIELIIALANYFKHRDDEHTLHPGTEAVLYDLNLNHKSIFEPEDLPIILGTEMLSGNFDLNIITMIVINWRESLWVEN